MEKPSAEKRNKGVGARILRDEEELTEVDKTKHYQSALRAKAEIYQKISCVPLVSCVLQAVTILAILTKSVLVWM
jgi:hypothetical protein